MSDTAEPADTTPVPRPVMGLYNRPFWDSVQLRSAALQRCDYCRAFRYPPGPVCPDCLSLEATWTALSGEATIMSWVVFHRQYLPAYTAPYTAIAVRLAEGPVMISNLVGKEPHGNWIGHAVRLVYTETPGGFILPRFCLMNAR